MIYLIDAIAIASEKIFTPFNYDMSCDSLYIIEFEGKYTSSKCTFSIKFYNDVYSNNISTYGKAFFSNFPKPSNDFSFILTHTNSSYPYAIAKITTDGYLKTYGNCGENGTDQQVWITYGTMTCSNISYDI